MRVKCLAEALHMRGVRCRGSCDEGDDCDRGLPHFLSSVTLPPPNTGCEPSEFLVNCLLNASSVRLCSVCTPCLLTVVVVGGCRWHGSCPCWLCACPLAQAVTTHVDVTSVGV